MSGLFLSYSRADRALADQIIRGLRAVGVAVWWDEDMRGVDWQHELENRINELAGVMVIWSPHSLNSNPVRDEARLGLESDKLVNVLCGISKPPFPYDRINGLPVDGWTGREPHRGWTRLIETVEERVVQAGGARPGDITVAQVLREQEVRQKQQTISAKQEGLLAAQARDAEAIEAVKSADLAVERAQEQLQRLAELRMTAAVLRTAQQEFDAASSARDEAERARRAGRAQLNDATAAVSQVQAELEDLLTATIEAPVLPERKGAAMARARPQSHAAPPQETPPPAPVAPSAPTPKARAKRPRAAPPPEPVVAEAAAPRPSPAPADPPIRVAAPEPAWAPALAWVKEQLRGSTARWLAIAGGVGVVAVALALVFARHGPSSATLAATALTTSAVAPTSPTAGAVQLAKTMTGSWALQGDTCGDPVTIAVNGNVLSFTLSGETTTGPIEPGPQPGVVNVQATDGLSSYAFHGRRSLWMVNNGTTSKMSKCAG